MHSNQREPDDNAGRFISRRPGVYNISSESSFGAIRDWLSTCHTHHRVCNRASDSKMPSYIIEITDTAASDPNLQLISRPSHVDYAALSYCWGGDQPVKVTKVTVKDLARGIPYARLPRTLRDAVTTTRKLGLRFLWVDALCVIQDDRVQAEREIALMPKIYENAYVTISAARSNCCERGFLHDISAPGPSSLAFRFSFRGPDYTIGAITCFRDVDDSHRKDPINDRAWALQEFLLSPRILLFGAYQLSWLCKCSQENENEKPLSNWWMKRDHRLAELRNILEGHQTQHSAQIDIWGPVVAEYTRRKLSDPDDRLLAISGIATEVGQNAEIEYMAGIWREDFPLALLWEVAWPREPRPTRYRAPSWSWAAVDGTIEFPMIRKKLNLDPDLKMVSSDLVLKETKAPYGAVERGTITVRGWVVSLRWIEKGTRLVHPERGDPLNGKVFAYTLPDADDLPSDISVYCLQICRYEPKTGRGPCGLVLTTEDGKVFRRRGIFDFYPDLHHDEAPEFHQLHREQQMDWVGICELREIIIE